MLIPIPNRLKDGGSVEYNAILYQYTKIHRLNEKSSTGYEDGWKLKILWFKVGEKINNHVIDEQKNDIGEEIDLKLKIKENTLTSVGLTMIVENNSDRDLQYGNPYSIEKYVDGNWKNAPTINDLFFTMPAFDLKKGESIELSINWEYGYGELKGKYRIVKEFSYKEKNDYIMFNKYLEFEI